LKDLHKQKRRAEVCDGPK